jgi:hypothetical protein
MIKNFIISILITYLLYNSNFWTDKPSGFAFMLFFAVAIIVVSVDWKIEEWRERVE